MPANNSIRDIESLIPQRPPIVMVDEFMNKDETSCHSTLTISSDNIFLDERNHMIAEGILEHIAQTAAAYIGYRRKLCNENVNFGYIGDIKRCSICGPMPTAGQELETDVRIVSQIENITMISAETRVNGQTIVNCRMKLAN